MRTSEVALKDVFYENEKRKVGIIRQKIVNALKWINPKLENL